jgi:hypothetical protein
MALPRHWLAGGDGVFSSGRHPQGRWFVNDEFVVAAADVLDERVSGDDDPG